MSETRGVGKEGPGSQDALQLCLAYHFRWLSVRPAPYLLLHLEQVPAAAGGTNTNQRTGASVISKISWELQVVTVEDRGLSICCPCHLV